VNFPCTPLEYEMTHDLEAPGPPKKRLRISGEDGHPELVSVDESNRSIVSQVVDADDEEEEDMQLEERQEPRASDLYLDTVSGYG